MSQIHFEFESQIQIYRAKKLMDSAQIQPQKQISNIQQEWKEEKNKKLLTPIKKKQQKIVQQYCDQMSPFVFPPKFNLGQTENTLGQNSNHTEMYTVFTPFNPNQDGLFRNGEMDGLTDLKIISGRIQWQTPKKDQSQNSEQYQQQISQQQQSIAESQDISNPQIPQQQISRQSCAQKPSNIQKKRVPKRSPQTKVLPQKDASKKVICNCKKTKCLKLYCDCFRINQTCQGCNCMGCHNLEDYADERNNAILVLMDRNPDPFSKKIQADQHLKGCNCKKSNCSKKYCQCYQAGLKCGENCKCQECKNGGHDKDGMPHSHAQDDDKPQGQNDKYVVQSYQKFQ